MYLSFLLAAFPCLSVIIWPLTAMEKIMIDTKWESSQLSATRWINIRVSSLVIFIFCFDTAANVFFLRFNLSSGPHCLFSSSHSAFYLFTLVASILTSIPDSSYHDFTIVFHLKLPSVLHLPPATTLLFLFFLSQLNMLLYVPTYLYLYIYINTYDTYILNTCIIYLYLLCIIYIHTYIIHRLYTYTNFAYFFVSEKMSSSKLQITRSLNRIDTATLIIDLVFLDFLSAKLETLWGLGLDLSSYSCISKPRIIDFGKYLLCNLINAIKSHIILFTRTCI